MGFRDKVKSLLFTTETKKFPYVNTKEERQEVIVGKVEDRILIPQQAGRSEKRDELEVPLSANELKWAARFKSKECPKCQYIFEQVKGDKRCPECKSKIVVRVHYQTKEECLLTEAEVEEFNQLKESYGNIKWCLRECKKYQVAAKDFLSDWKMDSKEESAFKVMWKYVSDLRPQYIEKGLLGSYRNTVLTQAEAYDRRKMEEETYKAYLNVGFWDANGPTNTKTAEGENKFEVQNAKQLRQTLKKIKEYQEKNDLSFEQLEADYLSVVDKDVYKDKLPLDAGQSCLFFFREYRKYLSELKEDEKKAIRNQFV
ncbi:hypothetical protein C1N87_31265 (plasmid) [Priestia aryabhattai]